MSPSMLPSNEGDIGGWRLEYAPFFLCESYLLWLLQSLLPVRQYDLNLTHKT